MRPPVTTHRRSARLPMAAMIDVVFLLLIYFVWTSGFERQEQDWVAMLSDQVAVIDRDTSSPWSEGQAETGSKPPAWSRLHVRLDWDRGRQEVGVWLNDRPLSGRDELRRRLSEAAKIGFPMSVIVHPDVDVPLADAIAIYDAVLAAGIERTYLATGGTKR